MKRSEMIKDKRYLRKIIMGTVMLAVASNMFCMSASAVPDTVQVIVNGSVLQTDQPAVIRSGRTMVPFKAIFSALGASVTWNEQEQKVTGVRDMTVIELFIGKKVANVNGIPVQMDVPVQIVNGRTMVPLSFVSSNLGAQVHWDGVNYIATVSMEQAPVIDGLFGGLSDTTLPQVPVMDVLPTPVPEPAPSPSPSAPDPLPAPTPSVEPPKVDIQYHVPPKDTEPKSNVLAGTFAVQNLKKENFVVQFSNSMTMDIKNVQSKQEEKGSYTVDKDVATLTSNMIRGSFKIENLKYNGREIVLLRDTSNGKNVVAITPLPYEEFVKIWTEKNNGQ